MPATLDYASPPPARRTRLVHLMRAATVLSFYLTIGIAAIPDTVFTIWTMLVIPVLQVPFLLTAWLVIRRVGDSRGRRTGIEACRNPAKFLAFVALCVIVWNLATRGFGMLHTMP